MKRIFTYWLVIMVLLSSIMIITDTTEVKAASGSDEINLYWVGLNETDGSSMLDKSISVEFFYKLKFAANSTLGWTNVQARILGWYDRGNLGLNSQYPAEVEEGRNSAFSILYIASNQTAWLEFPDGYLEMKIVDVMDTNTSDHPTDPGQSVHLVEIGIQFMGQMFTADGEGFVSVDDDYGPDKSTALLDPWSWDFNITVKDNNVPSAWNSSFGEFGIWRFSNVTAMGNPEAYGEPGDTAIKMNGSSLIKYSANSYYWMNISIENLERQGGGGVIPASNLAVKNIHPHANSSNSGTAFTPTHFTGPNEILSIWGKADDPMPPLGNGTFSAGPWMTNFNSRDNDSTYIEWWVDIPNGMPLGVYDWQTTVTVEAENFNIEFPFYVNGVHVVDRSLPESQITEITKYSDHWAINATANDSISPVTEVSLMYRYSEDNTTWGSWTLFESDLSAPWSWDFDLLDNPGYYEFDTVARDEGGNSEDTILSSETSVIKESVSDAYIIITIGIILAIVAIISAVWLRKRKNS